MPEPVLSQRTLNRTLLARQLLLEPAEMAPLDAAEHLVGLQAQLPTSPYIALRARLAGFDPAVMSQAMEDRRAVRIVLMRGTIHLVSIADALVLRPVIQPVLDRELLANRTWARGIEGVDLAKVKAYERKTDDRSTVLTRIDALQGAEPWPGYDELTVEEIRAAVGDDDERASSVRSYERAHKNRAGVLNAVERELTTA